ncbi:MAG: RES domain-containing protein [Acidobacteriaceae bacterium]|nr:RES domain-containing protein [Acidobacteriaceae bacterium]
MRALYRVFPFHAAAAENEPGGGLYVPRQGGGRLDNPEIYSVLYLSDSRAGAISEAFGRFPEWTAAILEGSPGLPGSARALGRYALRDDAAICDLDDPQQLQALGLRPSDVVSRDYARTRVWARLIHEQAKWVGARWWSYYDSRWASFGLWDIGGLRVEKVEWLRLDHAALIEASRVIARRIVEPRGAKVTATGR